MTTSSQPQPPVTNERILTELKKWHRDVQRQLEALNDLASRVENLTARVHKLELSIFARNVTRA